MNNAWVDPRDAESEEQFLYRYKAGWGMAQAVKEILSYLEKMNSQVDQLIKKKEGKLVDEFDIGA